MKRGKPLKRGKGLARKSELKADAEKVRAFVQRGRQATMSHAPGFRRVRSEEGPLSPAEWRAAVFVASGGVCMITGARARDVDDPRFEAHHVLPKRELRARRLWAYVWDPRNGLWLTKDAHARQEGASERLSRGRLPLMVWAFCRELDALDGTQWATEMVKRAHPERGGSPHSHRRS